MHRREFLKVLGLSVGAPWLLGGLLERAAWKPKVWRATYREPVVLSTPEWRQATRELEDYLFLYRSGAYEQGRLWELENRVYDGLIEQARSSGNPPPA